MKILFSSPKHFIFNNFDPCFFKQSGTFLVIIGEFGSERLKIGCFDLFDMMAVTFSKVAKCKLWPYLFSACYALD